MNESSEGNKEVMDKLHKLETDVSELREQIKKLGESMLSNTNEQRRDDRDLTRLQIWSTIAAAFGSILFGIFLGFVLTSASALTQSKILTGSSKIIFEHYGNTLMSDSVGWLLVASFTLGATIGVPWWITKRIHRRRRQN